MKYRNGQLCPACRGRNQVWMSRDAHRSEGWIPCTFFTSRKRHGGDKTVYIDLECVSGRLTRDFSVPKRERDRLNAIDERART